jgi:Tfp pilus assembly protein PilF
MSALKRKSQTLAVLLVGFLLCGGPSAYADEAATPTAASIEDGIADATNALHESDYGRAISRLENLQAVGRWEVPFWLGTAYLLDGQLENAALMLEDALSLQSEVVEIWVQRAVVAQEQQQPQVALQFLEVAAQVDGDFPLTFLNVGIAYESLGDVQNARGAYGRFLKLSSDSGETSRVRRLRRDVLTRIAQSGS